MKSLTTQPGRARLVLLALAIVASSNQSRAQTAPITSAAPSQRETTKQQISDLASPAGIPEPELKGEGVPRVSFDGAGPLAPSDQVPQKPSARPRFKFLRQVGSDFKHLPSKDSLYWLAGGGAVALAVHPQDDDVNQHLIPHDKFFNPGQTLGSVYVQGGSALATYVIGRATSNEKVKHLGTDMLSAQIVAQALTQVLKVSTQRERPDGSNNHSFPSGHASATFATATVLQRHLGWRAAVPTYTLASYVAMSRLQENRHFLSDVVFGGALGVVAGRTTTRHGRAHWAVIPDMSKGRAAVLLSRIP
jgi:membrane-associated phospholipid phosphatase